MAVFDVFTALAWAFATAPIPEEKFWIYGASGSEASCTTQAFFVQLGFTSVFYNVSLALYYVLVIVHDWREYTLVKIRPYLHGGPLFIGIVLAFAGFPFYDWFEYGCHLLPPPDGDMWTVVVFAVGPLGVAIISIITCMLTVYCKVRRQARTSRKWSMGVGTSNTLETQVFYQSFWYIMSFLVSWPILFAMYLASVDVGGPYGVTITIAFVAPLQGFSNFLVYIRPKVNQWKKERAKRAEKKNKLLNNSSAATAGSSFNPRSFLRKGLSKGRFNISSKGQSFANSFRFSGVSGLSQNDVSGLSTNSISINLNNESQATEITTPSTNDDSLLSEEALDDIDPSVLIALDNREEILEMQEKREKLENLKAEQEQQEQAPESAPGPTNVKPDTIIEGDEEGPAAPGTHVQDTMAHDESEDPVAPTETPASHTEERLTDERAGGAQ